VTLRFVGHSAANLPPTKRGPAPCGTGPLACQPLGAAASWVIQRRDVHGPTAATEGQSLAPAGLEVADAVLERLDAVDVEAVGRGTLEVLPGSTDARARL
jgi:hypothetical protein